MQGHNDAHTAPQTNLEGGRTYVCPPNFKRSNSRRKMNSCSMRLYTPKVNGKCYKSRPSKSTKPSLRNMCVKTSYVAARGPPRSYRRRASPRRRSASRASSRAASRQSRRRSSATTVLESPIRAVGAVAGAAVGTGLAATELVVNTVADVLGAVVPTPRRPSSPRRPSPAPFPLSPLIAARASPSTVKSVVKSVRGSVPRGTSLVEQVILMVNTVGVSNDNLVAVVDEVRRQAKLSIKEAKTIRREAGQQLNLRQ